MALNHRDFQVVIQNKPVLVANLTAQQAKDALCKLMLLLEKIEEDIFAAQVRLNEWKS